MPRKRHSPEQILRKLREVEAWNKDFLTGTFRPRIHLVNVAGSDVEAGSSVTAGRR
jgi:hypothetical protein